MGDVILGAESDVTRQMGSRRDLENNEQSVLYVVALWSWLGQMADLVHPFSYR